VIKAGTTVTWINNEHDVHAGTRIWESELFGQGGS
jgi:hypothetical protein